MSVLDDRLHDPSALFALWERQPWAASAIDLGQDRADWAALPPGLRERLLWHIAAFFAGEERVAGELDPLLVAARDADERAYVATQLVDEARHVRFFSRFCSEVAGVDGHLDDQLAQVRRHLGPALRELLDVRLARVAADLRQRPRDASARVRFFMVYHMVIEGTLALGGEMILGEALDRLDVLPGLRRALRHVARDEHRHIAYGTWALAAELADAPARAVAAACWRDLLPLAEAVFVPAGARPDRFRPFGAAGAGAGMRAMDGLRRRMVLLGLTA